MVRLRSRVKKETVFDDEKMLLETKLDQPWLVKVHQKLHLPLYSNEAELFADKVLRAKLAKLE